VLANFLTPKHVTALYHPLHSPDLPLPDYFLFPKLKIKGLHIVDAAEIQEAVTDELKKVQKEEFLAAFQKLYNHAKPVYMPMEIILNKNKRYVSSSCLQLKKKSVLKVLDRAVY
jgi:hypothetical protein